MHVGRTNRIGGFVFLASGKTCSDLGIGRIDLVKLDLDVVVTSLGVASTL